MNTELIKSFLVGLGFGVDDASLAKFNKAIKDASLKVAALYTSIQVASSGIFYSISKISEGFEEMGYSLRLVAPAVNKFLILRNAMLDAYRRAGVDLTKVVKQSILFNYSLAKTKFALEAVYKSVAAKFFPILTQQMDLFRQKIFANMPKIQHQLESFIRIIFRAFEATAILGARLYGVLEDLYDFFKRLDGATNGWSTVILGIAAAWKILNLSFLATPLGLLLTGLLAILALYDDFKVWKEGGKSFFNWSSAVPIINAVSEALDGVVNRLERIFTLLKGNWNPIKAIAVAADEISDSITSRFVGSKGENGLLPRLIGLPQPQPLVSNSASSSVKMNQSNTNNFYGVPGASEAVSSFADVSQRNNADLTRNFSTVNLLPGVR